jgi:hypothetical protein
MSAKRDDPIRDGDPYAVRVDSRVVRQLFFHFATQLTIRFHGGGPPECLRS